MSFMLWTDKNMGWNGLGIFIPYPLKLKSRSINVCSSNDHLDRLILSYLAPEESKMSRSYRKLETHGLWFCIYYSLRLNLKLQLPQASVPYVLNHTAQHFVSTSEFQSLNVSQDLSRVLNWRQTWEMSSTEGSEQRRTLTCTWFPR